MQRAITTKMLKLYPVDQATGKSVFVKARVIGDYNSLYKKCVKLKTQLEKLEAIRARNAKSEERVIKRKRNWLCMVREVDANDYYVDRVNDTKNKIRTEKSIQMKRNSGSGFLIFSDFRVPKDFLYDRRYFNNLIHEKLSPSAIQRLNMQHWFFKDGIIESDIIWESIVSDQVISAVKTFMLWVLLLLISVILITPVLLVNISSEIIANLNWDIPFLSNENFNTYLTSAMTVFLNIILIPFLIDMMVLIEDHPTKSIR